MSCSMDCGEILERLKIKRASLIWSLIYKYAGDAKRHSHIGLPILL